MMVCFKPGELISITEGKLTTLAYLVGIILFLLDA